MKNKEYENPFFKVVLNYDETKPESDYEKELVKRYLNFLTEQQEKRNLIKALRNRYYHEQFIVDEATPELDKIAEKYMFLVKAVEKDNLEIFEYFTEMQKMIIRWVFPRGRENKNDRTEFINVENEGTDVNNNYTRYHKETVDKVRDIINENEKDFKVLMNWFENDQEGSKAFSNFNNYANELYKNYNQYSLDSNGFYRSTEKMKREWQKFRNEWDELYDIREKTVALSAIYTEKITKANELVETLQEMIEQFLAGKFKPIKAKIEEIEVKCIQFRFLEKELFSPPTSDLNQVEVQFRVDYEIDKLSDNLWIFNMDNYVHAHHEMYLHMRTSFKIPLTKNDMLSKNILTSFFERGFQHAFLCAHEFYKKEKKKSGWADFKMLEETKTFLLNNLAERIAGYDDTADELTGYLRDCLDIEGTLVERGTILILNEVLFYNSAFNWKQNQDAFSKIIPLRSYVTLRCIVERSSPDKPQTINVGRMLLLMLCIECASQLLTGDHLPALEPALDKVKFDHAIRREFLRQAQEFVKDVLDEFKKINSTFVDMEEEFRDWNALIQ
ncbi:MAG: hypothetical protein ABI855_09630 [Bacteroidota bacterium]